MFVVNTHPFCQGRAPRLPSYDLFGFGAPVYSLVPEPALEDTVQLARARYLHALEEQEAAREAYAAHQLRAFQDEAAVYLHQQQQRRRQAAIEEAQRARREQLIQARREKELRRRRQEIEEHEFSQALMLAFGLATQVEPRHVERAPAGPACACGHRHSHRPARPAPVPAPPQPTSVPVGAAPSRPVPVFQPRVRFSPPVSSSRVPVPSPSKPAATPVTLKSALKPTSPPAPIRIGIRESKAESSSASAPTPPQPAAAAAAIRVPIRESKGKASSQVRINVVSTAASQSLAPADAIAALSLLEADLDALNPATSVPLLRHQLNGILESVDAIESGGHDAVREVRRALVRRIEEALVAVEHGDAIPTAPRRSAGITINEPAASRVEVKAVPQPAPSAVPVVHSDATAAPMPVASEQVILEDVDVAPEPQEPAAPSAMTDAAPVVEGYVVDDFLEPTPAAPSSPAPSSTPARLDEPAVPDHAEPAPISELAAAFEEDQGITSAGAEPIAATDEGSVAMADGGPVATSALANDDSISVDAASSGVHLDSVPTSPTRAAGPASLPAAIADLPATIAEPTSPAAVAAEPTSPVVADPDGLASPTPNETPLTASYPPAQTFAAPTHPAVDAGSDGEWERPGSSGSEGEKSDYEVV